MNILEKITEIFFPTKCGICGKLGYNICEDCYNDLKKFEIKEQHKDIFFVYRYEDIVRKFIIDYKFNGKSYLYKTFCESLLKNKKVCKFLNSYDIILSVPLHKKRLRERGYNQSALIAKDLAKRINIKYLDDVLIKIKNTKPQSTKGLNERIKDVVGIYEVLNNSCIKGKNILLFDDIYTTGSTTNECKKVLLEAGAKNVGILTLAKDYIN